MNKGQLILMWAGIAIMIFLNDGCRKGPHGQKVICGTNLRGIGIAMMVYANDNDDRFPTADKWCDLLVVHYYVDVEQFVCDRSDVKVGESSYAMNKNIVGVKASDIPEDVVLLFESKPGWNQAGGPEILTAENHNGEGCNILFGDRRVRIVETERLGELKWKLK